MKPFVIDLDAPPTANRMLGHGNGRVYRTRAYSSWLAESDAKFIKLGLNKGRAPIPGPFKAKIFLSEGLPGDMDNYAKPLLDWAQRVGVIKNDKHLRSLDLRYGDIGGDVRLVIEAVP